MKHQVLFFISISSFLSYSSEHSRILAGVFYNTQHFRMMTKGIKIDPIEEVRLVAQCNYIANIPMTAKGKEEGLQLIYQAMQEDGSWDVFVKRDELHNDPQKRCEIC